MTHLFVMKGMIHKIFLTFLLALAMSGCNLQARPSGEPIVIQRFDEELLKLIATNDSSRQIALQHKYPLMLELVGKAILNIQSPDQPGFFDRLINFYSEPTLNRLYRDAIAKYTETDDIAQELGNGFAYLSENLPARAIPVVYMHVSGLNQNVLVGDNILSVSIDKYMGADYPLYQDFFYPYQLRKMCPAYIVPDYLTGWLMSEFPFTGKENILLDRMIYEGKIKYLVSQALPDRTPAQLLGYTEEEYAWIKKNESAVWKTIIERKHLYTPDHITTTRYFEEMPSQFIADEAPGNLGSYIGWQIVERYMKETKISPNELMQENKTQDMLKESKYKP